MNIQNRLSEFQKVDEKLNAVHQLTQYDPLTSIIKERFQLEITRHLTSLKARSEISASKVVKIKNCEPEMLKQAYLAVGKEHAVTQFLFDLSEQSLSIKGILLLAEILFGETIFRQKEIFITNVSGNRQNTPKAANVPAEMEKLVEWFNLSVKEKTLHPIAQAAYLHHQLTTIHPFDDWNGRVARLVLNVALMKYGYLPVLINSNERLAYYENLEKADSGDIEPLTRFIALKEIETIDEFMNSPEYLSIQTKYNLEHQVRNIGGTEKCIVLTEDSATDNILSLLLEASGFNIAETKVISYEGCSKIGSANLFSIFVKEKMPNVKILVHRDRDYLTDAEISMQRDSFRRVDAHLFVTRGTDIESYLLNSRHVAFCHPSISEEMAQKLIDDSRAEIYSKSVDYLRKKEFGGNKTEQYTHLNKALEDLVSNNLIRFTHGKTAYKVLQYKIQDVAHQKANLEQCSQFLYEKELNKIARSIWNI